jgi:hypothetical protein
MLFYEVADNTAHEKKWTFAVGIHPKSHIVRWGCPDCGRGAQYPAGNFDVTLEGGSKFPDVLGCGAYPLLILSQRALKLFNSTGIGCFQQYPVGVAAVNGSHLRAEESPAYYRTEVTGECMIDFKASGARITSICERCGEIRTDPPIIRRFKIIEGSWNGCDLFRDHRYYPRVSFCTQRVVELAKAHGITNCHFEQMG